MFTRFRKELLPENMRGELLNFLHTLESFPAWHVLKKEATCIGRVVSLRRDRADESLSLRNMRPVTRPVTTTLHLAPGLKFGPSSVLRVSLASPLSLGPGTCVCGMQGSRTCSSVGFVRALLLSNHRPTAGPWSL
jgi:hypothetical protein